MLPADRSLMHSQQPAFQQAGYQVAVRQQIIAQLGLLANHLMGVSKLPKATIARPAIRPNRSHWFHRLLDGRFQAGTRSIGDNPKPYSPHSGTLHLCGYQHQCFPISSASPFARLLSADVALIYLYDSGQPVTAWPDHSPAKFLEPSPGSAIASQAKSALQSQSVGPVLLAGDVPHGPKPKPEGLLGVLEDRPRSDRGLESTLPTLKQSVAPRPRSIMVTFGHLNPSGQRRLKRYSRHAASELNRSSNSSMVDG